MQLVHTPSDCGEKSMWAGPTLFLKKIKKHGPLFVARVPI
jgi:hypothetical protein